MDQHLGMHYNIPELSGLSKEQLDDLLICDEKLNEFVDNLPQITKLRDQNEQLMNYNVAAANSTLERKEEYEKNREETIKKVEELTLLRNKFDNLTLQHQDISEKLLPHNLKEMVLIGAAQSEEESEKIAEKFLDKKLDVDAFLNNYLDKRIESHLRKFKGERFGRQLRELQRAGF